MIYICDIWSIDPEIEFDEKWAIARHMKLQSNNPGIVQHEELSPSEPLFARAKRGEIDFRKEYVPRFIEEIADHQESTKALDYLVQADKDGKNIALICSCDNENECHRSIIGGILQGMGAKVSGLTRDYSFYHRMLFETQGRLEQEYLYWRETALKEMP